MKVEFEDNAMVLVPENPNEKEEMNKRFPYGQYSKKKQVSTYQFVNRYGKPSGDHYLRIRCHHNRGQEILSTEGEDK